MMKVNDKYLIHIKVPASREEENLSVEIKLVADLKTRKKWAFTTLYKMYSRALYSVISKILPETAVAEDILQETFIKVYHFIHKYDSNKGRLFSWLINIARNLAIDTLRSLDFRNSKKNHAVENNIDYIDAQKKIYFNPDKIGLKDLLHYLSADQYLIIDHIYFKGFTHTEAAEHLNMPLGTVKTKTRAALITLREIYKNDERLLLHYTKVA